MIRKVEMERLSVTSARLFDEVVAAIKAPYGNSEALNVARDLDAKVEDLLRQAAA